MKRKIKWVFDSIDIEGSQNSLTNTQETTSKAYENSSSKNSNGVDLRKLKNDINKT